MSSSPAVSVSAERREERSRGVWGQPSQWYTTSTATILYRARLVEMNLRRVSRRTEGALCVEAEDDGESEGGLGEGGLGEGLLEGGIGEEGEEVILDARRPKALKEEGDEITWIAHHVT